MFDFNFDFVQLWEGFKNFAFKTLIFPVKMWLKIPIIARYCFYALLLVLAVYILIKIVKTRHSWRYKEL